MDEILALKNKHVNTSVSHLKELSEKQVKLIDHVKNKRYQHFNEDETKIEELTQKLTLLKENLQAEKEMLECKNRDLSKHLDCVKELEAERNKFLEENQLLLSQKNKLIAAKPNERDEELMQRGKRKLALYKELTGVYWDYEAHKESAKGYVTNKKDYIYSFCYKNETDRNLSDLLWEEIYKSIGHQNNVGNE